MRNRHCEPEGLKDHKIPCDDANLVFQGEEGRGKLGDTPPRCEVSSIPVCLDEISES